MPRQSDVSNLSPLRDRPLHNPGQSLDQQLRDLLDEKILIPVLAAVILVVLAAMSWIHWLLKAPPNPLLMTLVAGSYSIYVAVVVRRRLRHVATLKLGRDGERAVGQYLELLREGGARVFHDVTADGFNIDHVVMSPHGIFAIETKTWSKPRKGDPRIQFDGQRLRAGKLEPDREPIRQVTAQAGWLKRLLFESTGKTFSVTPVVVFPGWFVEPSATTEARKVGVWLLNPRALPSFIEQVPESVKAEDVKLAAFHLSRYIRTTTA
jgi:hypothetical protein